MSFPQFAFNNIKRNARAYFAYLLSSSFMVMIFFTFASFIYHPQMQQIEMGMRAATGMRVATVIIYVFAIFFVLYSISVFLKSRNKEFGILTILGASSGQINRLIFLENMMIGFTSIVLGIGFGMLLSKLFLLLCGQMIDIGELSFYWPLQAGLVTVTCFVLLFLSISLVTLLFIRRNRVIELLTGTSKPKKEPRVSIWLSLFGAVLLTIGYVTIQSGVTPESIILSAITGIAGTYFFYSQLFVLAIRLLKRSRGRMWRGTRLLWISEMSYKIKDNARVLFLITVVTSLASMSTCVVLGLQRDNNANYYSKPYAASLVVFNEIQEEAIAADRARIQQELQAADVLYDEVKVESLTSLTTEEQYVTLLPMRAFNNLAVMLDQTPVERLSAGKALLVLTGGDAKRDQQGAAETIQIKTLQEAEGKLQVTQSLSDERYGFLGRTTMYVIEDALYDRWVLELPTNNDSRQSISYLYIVPEWNHSIPQPQDPEALVSTRLAAWDQAKWQAPDSGPSYSYLSIRYHSFYDLKQQTDLFSFIGIFLALIFSVSSASFLYFKLYTELSADGRMYHSLSKIGLSVREMRSSAARQIAVLFYLPMAVSAIQTLVVARPFFYEMGIYNVITPVLITSGAFLAAQTVYFVLVQSRYVRTLKRMMV